MRETGLILGARPPVPSVTVARAVTPFALAGGAVRGRLARLGPLADALLTRHDNPDIVTALAGQALALTAALAASLKFEGNFSLQVKGDGPVNLLLADCTDAGALRGYARADRPALDALLARDPAPDAGALLGSGYFALTVDGGERHQGIVSIEGRTLAEAALHYFAASEQVRVTLRLVCARTGAGWRAAALVLERIPDEGGTGMAAAEAEETWRTACVLGGTVREAEMLDDDLPAEVLLRRLFHEVGVAPEAARPLSYGCRCSRAKLAGILRTFPDDDLDAMDSDGAIVMTCEFCNHDFVFARDALADGPGDDG